MNKDQETVVSLFSGAMGLDNGLENAGFKTVVCADNDAACRKTISANRPDIKVFDDVHDITAKSAPKEPFIVAGGPPCQSWSMAGRRKGFKDPRGSLLLDFGRVVQELNPRFFVMENVRGLLSLVTDDGKSAIDILLKLFDDIGYKTVHGILNAVDFGVPQFRERVVVIGSRDGEDIILPRATHFSVHQDPGYRWKTLRDAIAWGWPNKKHEYVELSPKRKKWMEKVPEGGNWKSLSDKDQRAAMGDAFFSGGGKTGFFRRLSFDEPSPTLVTSPSQKSTILCHPTETRPLSVQEYTAIQTFPDGWELEGSAQEKYRQLGNAVPVLMGEAIGAALLAAVKGGHSSKAARLRLGEAPRKGKKKKNEEDDLAAAGSEFWGE